LSHVILEKLGLSGSPVTVKKFSNSELSVDLGVSVRNEDVFIIQSGSTSINDHLMELLIMINACKLASAKRITAVLPYFPYGKQSKKKKARGSITAKLIANMLAVAGVDHIITMDLHSSQIQGFFTKPVDNLLAEPGFAKYIKEKYDVSKCIIVSKNAGGTKRVTSLADRLECDFALIHREKYHIPQQATEDTIETRLTVVGDVKGMMCFLMDDMIDGTHSFLDACEHLKACEAARVVILAVHGILSGNACQDLQNSKFVDDVVVTNTYPVGQTKLKVCPKLKILCIAGVLAEAIRRTHNGESISYLFHTAM
jgi:ribose-phosphate pyrophosphokinase